MIELEALSVVNRGAAKGRRTSRRGGGRDMGEIDETLPEDHDWMEGWGLCLIYIGDGLWSFTDCPDDPDDPLPPIDEPPDIEWLPPSPPSGRTPPPGGNPGNPCATVASAYEAATTQSDRNSTCTDVCNSDPNDSFGDWVGSYVGFETKADGSCGIRCSCTRGVDASPPEDEWEWDDDDDDDDGDGGDVLVL